MITKVTAAVMRVIGASIHYRPSFILLLKERTGDAKSGDAEPLIRFGVGEPLPESDSNGPLSYYLVSALNKSE